MNPEMIAVAENITTMLDVLENTADPQERSLMWANIHSLTAELNSMATAEGDEHAQGIAEAITGQIETFSGSGSVAKSADDQAEDLAERIAHKMRAPSFPMDGARKNMRSAFGGIFRG